jgi:murein DD-endopeptidase MepM/ murein hydrolase activator NlpD
MARQHHTVIIVPHARAKLRKWRVTNLQIGLAVALFLALTAAAAFVLFSYFRAPASPAEMARLRRENEQLRRVNLGFESSFRRLQDQLVQNEERARQLAIVAGVAGIESLGTGAEAGVGGGAPVDEASDYDLAAMEVRSGRLAGRLDEVESHLAERLRWISSTPAIAPVKGILTSGFGYRADPITHGRGVHQGVDIAAAPGQPVKASADGVVIRAGMVGGLGRAVYLAHGYGLTTRYGHMSRVDVRAGQRVRRGDVLGLVGNTGRSTGYHLHYEVRLDGEPVNPLGYILDEAAGSAF